jgi:hypothetical protein
MLSVTTNIILRDARSARSAVTKPVTVDCTGQIAELPFRSTDAAHGAHVS